MTLRHATPHERLRSIREAANVSQAALAQIARCAPSYISKIESGQRTPGRKIALALAQFTADYGRPIQINDWP